MKKSDYQRNFTSKWSFLFFFMVCIIFTAYSQQLTQFQVCTFKHVISTDIKLTKSLAVSQGEHHLMVGSREGNLKVYNYESGRQVYETNQQDSQIVSILWQNNRQGLVTISFNHQQNKSVAILRQVNGFQEVHRWQFQQLIYNADSVSFGGESYVGFNFMTRVQEYNIRTRAKKVQYLPTENRRFVQMSYSSQYKYLFLSGNGQFMYAFRCGSVYRFYYGLSDLISRFEADKSNSQHSPVIYKKQYSGFELLDPSYQFNVSFPSRKIDYFKYCPRDYILGIDIDQSIVIYSRDYQFTQLAVIDSFSQQNLFIVSVVCQNDHIIATASDDKIYVYQLYYQHHPQSNFWVIVVAIAAGVTLLLIIITVIFIKNKAKRKLKIKKISSPSLLTSDPNYSVISDLTI